MVGMKHIHNQHGSEVQGGRECKVVREGKGREKREGKRETHQGNIIVELWFSSEESHDVVPFNVLATIDKHRSNANEIINNRKVKVKQSLHRPGKASSIPGG
jgi:hypothetical protein